MKKSLISPVCSAVIIPGLGQVINQQIKKGLIILALVFVLFIAGIIELALIVNSLLDEQVIATLNSEVVMQRLGGEDFSLLWVLIIAFGIVWLYSVIDAFIGGLKIDREGKGDLR